MTAGPGDGGYQQHKPQYGGFSEADLVEQPAIELFAKLGRTTGSLFGEFSGGASAEGRSSKRDEILPNRLRLALKRLNPAFPQEALDDAFSILTCERGAIDPIRANAGVHDLLRQGVAVDVRGPDGARKTEIVRVVEWQNPEKNVFFLASQVWFAGELYTKRADLVGFVNGLPLLFVELKASHKAMADAYNDNLTDYRATIPHVFTPNAFVILSNGLDAVLGASYALIAGKEERTREVFGDYVSIYDFAQSIADGATVPLYYESCLPELHLTYDELGDEIDRVIDEADLGEDEEDAIARRFARQYHLITNEDRLDKVAADLVRHFSGRGYRGKAMFIAIDKATAIRMYDNVQRHWAEMLAREAERVAKTEDSVARGASGAARLADQDGYGGRRQLLAERNRPHGQARPRHRAASQAHGEGGPRRKIKAPEDPLRLVFVCAMWITGFDVPTCSTVYIDKPMKNHTPMQTIARANRVAPGKRAGLIVDYVGVFRNLKEALAIYAKPRPGVTTDPIERKDELVEALRTALDQVLTFAAARAVHPADVLRVTGFERQAALQEAAERLLGTDDDKRAYLRLVGDAWKLFRAVLPDPAANDFRGDMIVLYVVAEMIRTMTRKQPSKNVLAAIAEIERLIDEAISGAAVRAPVPSGEDMKRLFDLSTLDFERLAELFARGEKKTATEILRGQTEERARALANRNPIRIDLLERLSDLIDRYNAGSLDVERLFEELTAFTRALDEEEQRHLKEGLDEDELAVFDILTRREPKLSKAEELAVKKIARQLLVKLKREKFILDWRLREAAKADVRETIRQEYDPLPPVYGLKLWEDKVERTYRFVFEHFGSAQPNP